MAGPVYHSDLYPFQNSRLPSYYDGKLLFYDWMRDWIMAATFDENNNLLYHEPFLPEMTFANIMDMVIAPDGSLYMLEYGTNWFSQNPDATLSRIDYAEGNRKPVAKMTAGKKVGAAPMEVEFAAFESLDFDRDDQLTFEWKFQESDDWVSGDSIITFTYQQPGIYYPKVRVTDQGGANGTAEMEVKVGNDVPEVAIQMAGNQTFYWDYTPIRYQVEVNDTEDGNYPGQGIPADRISFSIDYMSVGLDETMVAQGHRQKGDLLSGASLIETHNCFACHKVDEKSIGPTYNQVAERYPETPDNIEMLANKIIKGGNGNWGEQNMSAHPQVTPEEAKIMVNYVLALNDKPEQPEYALQDSYLPQSHLETNTRGYYVFTATYTDRGGEVIGPQRGEEALRLRYPQIEAEDYQYSEFARKRRPAGTEVDLVLSNNF